MPQYFFNFHSDGLEVRAPEGQPLLDLDAAREEAIEGVREIAADRVRYGAPLDLGGRCEIADEDGNILLTVTFRDALTIKA